MTGHLSRLRQLLSLAFVSTLFFVGTLQTASAATVTTINTDNPNYSGTDTIIGASGYPQIAISSDAGVKLVTCTNDACTASTTQLVHTFSHVTNSDVEIKMERAANSFPVLVFMDYSNSTLYQLRCSNETCTAPSLNTINVVIDQRVEEFTILPNGNLAILVHQPGNVAQRDLEYILCNNTACSAPTITTIYQSQNGFDNYFLGDGSDIEVDSNGNVHIAYIRKHTVSGNDLDKIYHVLCTGSDCSAPTTTLAKDQVAPYTNQDKTYLDMELTRDNFPRMAYAEYIDSIDDNFYSSVAQAHILFCNDTNCTSATDKNIKSDWYSGEEISLELNSLDYPLLAYKFQWRGNATAMTNNQTSFGSELTQCFDTLCTGVERATMIDPYTANDLNHEGVTWISLTRNQNDDVFTAQVYRPNRLGTAARVDVAFQPAMTETYPKKETLFAQATYRAGGINHEVGQIGLGIQSAKGTDGLPRLAYYDYWMDTVRYVKCLNIECSERIQSTVDGTGDSVNFQQPSFGGYLDIDIGTDGLARILYSRGGNGDQMAIAICNDDFCRNPTIRVLGDNATNLVFRSMDLELSPTNVPYVVYNRMQTPITPPYLVTSYLGNCSDAVCTSFSSFVTEAPADTMTGSTGTAFTPGGQFMTVHFDFQDGMELWRCTNTDCTTRVETQLKPSFATTWIYRVASIRFGTDGLPRISYLDPNNFDPHFILCNDLDCTSYSEQTLPFDLDTDFFNMELNSANLPRFSATTYRQPDYMGELEYVYCTTEDCSANNMVVLNDSSAVDDIAGSYWNDLMLSDDDIPIIVNQRPLFGSDTRVQVPELIRCFDATCVTRRGPSAPTTLFSNNTSAQAGQTNPANLANLAVLFTGLFQDQDAGNTAQSYQLQLSTDGWFENLIYDSNKTALGAPVAINARSENLNIPGGTVNYDTPYFWRLRFWDDQDIQGLFSATHVAANTFTVINTVPGAPTGLLASGLTDPVGLTSTDVTFSAVHHDTNGDAADQYRIQIASDSGFTSIVFDSGVGGTAMPSTADNARNTPDIDPVTALVNGNTYYWRIKFWDDQGGEGAFSATAQFTILPGDSTAPAITAQTPSASATNVALSPSFSYALTDADSNVDISTVNISVNGTPAITNGACSAGFTCTSIPGADGPSVTFAFTRDAAFTNGQTVTVTINASDTAAAPNSLSASTSFTTLVAATTPAASFGGSGGGFSSAQNSYGDFINNNSNTSNTNSNTGINVPVINLDVSNSNGGTWDNSDTTTLPTRPSAPAVPGEEPVVSLCEIQRLNLNRGTVIRYEDIAESDFRTLVREFGLVLSGENDPTNPFRYITRSEMLRLILQTQCGAFDIPKAKDAPFPDVSKSHRDAIYVGVAKAQDIVTGYLSDGTFRPDNDISRAEALKIVLEVIFRKQYGVIQGVDQKSPRDVSKDAWYYRYANFASEHGVIDENAFRPDEKATREDIAGFLLESIRVMSLVDRS